MAIEAEHYEETRLRLIQDPIVRDMAKTLPGPGSSMDHILHEDGTPRFQFMQAANNEYRSRGGKDGGHIGAIAEALIRILNGA